MTASKPERRPILGADGEIQDLDSLLQVSEQDPEPVFCVRCGTANAPDSNYCRKCGTPMEQSQTEGGGRKRKMEELSEPRPSLAPESARASGMSIFAAISQLATFLFIAGIAISAITIHGANNAWIAVPTMISLFLVEAVRSGKRHRANAASMITEIGTLIFVSGMAITALAVGGGGNSWMVVPILIFWFLIEAVRSGG